MAIIKFLDSVKINGAHFEPHIARILQLARDTAPPFVDATLWVTSANDGRHMQGSRHYTNEAFDLRVRNIRGHVSREAKEWAARLKERLGRGYDVVFEGDHIHVEFDPN